MSAKTKLFICDGVVLPFEEMGTNTSAQRLKQFVREACDASQKLKGDGPATLYITAGEGTDWEYRQAESVFQEFLSHPHSRVRLAAGPVLSSDPQGRSVFVELAKTFLSRFELYILPTRESEHWKLFTFNGSAELLQLEQPHRPAPRFCHKVTLSPKGFLFGLLANSESLPQHKSIFKELSETRKDTFLQMYVKAPRFQPDKTDPMQRNEPTVLPTRDLARAYRLLHKQNVALCTVRKEEILAVLKGKSIGAGAEK